MATNTLLPLIRGGITSGVNNHSQTYGSSSSGSLSIGNPTFHNADFTGKLTVNGIEISSTLQTICDRLTILVPDQKKLEKYEALRQAYEHYKLLEALLTETEKKC